MTTERKKSFQSKDSFNIEICVENKPIAFCNIVSIIDTTITVRIYSITTRFEGQYPASILNTNKNYYPWVDIIINGEFLLSSNYTLHFHNYNRCTIHTQMKQPLQHKSSHADIDSLMIQLLEYSSIDYYNL